MRLLVSRPPHFTVLFLQLVRAQLQYTNRCHDKMLQNYSWNSFHALYFSLCSNTPYHLYIFCRKLISWDILKWLNLWDYCFHKVGEVLRDVSDDRRTSRARVMGDNFRQTAVRGGEVVMACLCCPIFVKTHLDKKSVHSVTVSLDFFWGKFALFAT